MAQLYPNSKYRQQMMAQSVERGHDYRDWEWEVTCKDGGVKIVSWSNISQEFPIPGWAAWGPEKPLFKGVGVGKSILHKSCWHNLRR